MSRVCLLFCLLLPVASAAAANPAGDMVWIPGGEFTMGAPDPGGIDNNRVGMHATADSRPLHRVRISGFWIDRTEVT
ncbi:MAG: formylglycine-generating enzyme family protein, partial [Gammaproteobacteria bacterium]